MMPPRVAWHILHHAPNRQVTANLLWDVQRCLISSDRSHIQDLSRQALHIDLLRLSMKRLATPEGRPIRHRSTSIDMTARLAHLIIRFQSFPERAKLPMQPRFMEPAEPIKQIHWAFPPHVRLSACANGCLHTNGVGSDSVI